MNRRNQCNHHEHTYEMADYGPEPFITDICSSTRQNRNFRTALWTGNHLQLTLMSIPAGEDIGLEIHPDEDQLLRIEQGCGFVQMGSSQNALYYQKRVSAGYVVFIPAGTWHNVINIGDCPLKLYSVYAPPHHPHGTVHKTKEDDQHGDDDHLL